MLRLDTAQADFSQRLSGLLAFETAQDPAVDHAVAAICADVHARGDAAVIEYSNRFDRLHAVSMHDLTLERAELEAAWNRLTPVQRDALGQAAERVRRYHERQRASSWSY